MNQSIRRVQNFRRYQSEQRIIQSLPSDGDGVDLKSYQNYLANNFNLKNVKDKEIFLVGGTEKVPSAIQTMVNREATEEKLYVCMPNPYYQIYGGATCLPEPNRIF